MGKNTSFRFLTVAVIGLALGPNCSRDRDSSTSPRMPDLGSGFTLAEWRATPCSGDPCLTQITLSRDRSGNARLIVAGESETTVEVTGDEVQTAFDAVERAIWSRGMTHSGCTNDGPEEWLSSFAGDNGRSVPIQGCVTGEVEEARRTLRAIAERHIP